MLLLAISSFLLSAVLAYTSPKQKVYIIIMKDRYFLLYFMNIKGAFDRLSVYCTTDNRNQ